MKVILPSALPNNSVERDGPKLRFGFLLPSAPAPPHAKRYTPTEKPRGTSKNPYFPEIALVNY